MYSGDNQPQENSGRPSGWDNPPNSPPGSSSSVPSLSGPSERRSLWDKREPVYPVPTPPTRGFGGGGGGSFSRYNEGGSDGGGGSRYNRYRGGGGGGYRGQSGGYDRHANYRDREDSNRSPEPSDRGGGGGGGYSYKKEGVSSYRSGHDREGGSRNRGRSPPPSSGSNTSSRSSHWDFRSDYSNSGRYPATSTYVRGDTSPQRSSGSPPRSSYSPKFRSRQYESTSTYERYSGGDSSSNAMDVDERDRPTAGDAGQPAERSGPAASEISLSSESPAPQSTTPVPPSPTPTPPPSSSTPAPATPAQKLHEESRLTKEKMVLQMSAKDDEITKFEKELEAAKKERDRIKKELTAPKKSAAQVKAENEQRAELDNASQVVGEDPLANLINLIYRTNKRLAFEAVCEVSELDPPVVEAAKSTVEVKDEEKMDVEEGGEKKSLAPKKEAMDWKTIDLPVVKAKEPAEYDGANAEIAKFAKLKQLMVKLLGGRITENRVREEELRENYRKQWVVWKRKIRQRRQDEASERIIAAVHSGRKFPMRASRVVAEEKALAKKMERREEEEDDERFIKTAADIPPMAAFDWKQSHRTFHMIDDNRLVEDSAKLEREYRFWNPWHPEEETVFVKAFLKYPKDFERIATFLPDKTVKDCIWFYYSQKNRLDLKRRLQRAGNQGVGVISEIGIGWDSQPLDPDAVGAHLAFGSAIDWVNGAGRRGSLRLSDKKVNYSEKSLERTSITKYMAEAHPSPSVQFTAIPPSGSATGSPTPLGGSNGSKSTPIVSPTPTGGKGRGRPRQGRATASPGPGTASPGPILSGVPLNPNLAISPAPPAAVAVPAGAPLATTSHWTDEEKQKFMDHLSKYGKDWKTISELIGTKSMNQIKNFFQNYRVKLKLEDLLPKNPLPPPATLPTASGVATLPAVSARTARAARGRRGRPRGGRLSRSGDRNLTASGGKESDDDFESGDESGNESGNPASPSRKSVVIRRELQASQENIDVNIDDSADSSTPPPGGKLHQPLATTPPPGELGVGESKAESEPEVNVGEASPGPSSRSSSPVPPEPTDPEHSNPVPEDAMEVEVDEPQPPKFDEAKEPVVRNPKLRPRPESPHSDGTTEGGELQAGDAEMKEPPAKRPKLEESAPSETPSSPPPPEPEETPIEATVPTPEPTEPTE